MLLIRPIESVLARLKATLSKTNFKFFDKGEVEINIRNIKVAASGESLKHPQGLSHRSDSSSKANRRQVGETPSLAGHSLPRHVEPGVSISMAIRRRAMPLKLC